MIQSTNCDLKVLDTSTSVLKAEAGKGIEEESQEGEEAAAAVPLPDPTWIPSSLRCVSYL